MRFVNKLVDLFYRLLASISFRNILILSVIGPETFGNYGFFFLDNRCISTELFRDMFEINVSGFDPSLSITFTFGLLGSV